MSIVLNVKRQNGAAIKAIRQAQNIKLRDMARRIDVNAGFLCHVEANRCYASQRTLNALAMELGVDVDAISRHPA